jgi:hypothetical protein
LSPRPASAGPILLLLAVCALGHAQQYEAGGLIGYGIYRDVRVNAAAGEASVGIRNRFAAGAFFCEDLYEHLSGEIRYLYQDGDPFVSLGSRKGNVQGQSHAIHYDVLIHLHERDRRFRPYIAAGIGAKYYRTTGPEPSPQPLPQIVTLVQANEWKWLVTLGAGVQYRLREHLTLRGDFRDYITPFPTRLFVPAANGTDRGLFQQFSPTLGVSYSF